MKFVSLTVFAIAFILCGCSRGNHKDAVTGPEGGVSKEELALVIEKFVAAEAAEHGYLFAHPDTKEDLALKLVKVHKERLSQTAPGTYFACADFAAGNEKVFDLDFWVKGSAAGLKVVEVHLHKEDGEARYQWREDGGVWSRFADDKPLGKIEGASEHPEHPEGHEHPEGSGDHDGDETPEHPEHPEHPTDTGHDDDHDH